ncbi:G-patch domain-containing protein [Pseudomassariella vexata]|uniref:G-patch domain-containing protein n=1 Tax=Pseudomassariella vexata TaxID=1141098 RepID=A0A1Y2E165_9PEZI|nr:G-patch domain-containing protein [Pseudomassariella vexata]ORY65301.1 G-patch domain-containing protein [Pseudomassariella vexata]
MASDDDVKDGIPLQHRKPFGAGLRRKQVVFVPASSGNLNSMEENISAAPARSVADMYLDLVLPNGSASASATPESITTQLCEVCDWPLDQDPSDNLQRDRPNQKHEASIAHQVCLTHSHPPSALDRSRMGLAVLSAQGWDPDARRGLGATQSGIQYPIKVKPKKDTLGIGVKVPRVLEPKKEKVQKLDAKKARQMALEDKKRREQLQRQFYGNSDLQKYLGTG